MAWSDGLERQDPRVAAGGELGGGLGQRVLLGEGQRERRIDVHQVAEPLETRDLPAGDVVEDRVPVLGEEAEDRQHVLGDVRHRDHEQRPGHVDAPGVVPLQVRLLGRQVQPLVRQPLQPALVALDHELGRDLLDGGIDQRAGVPGREEVHARVVGEEELGRVEAGRGREGAPGGRAGVVGGVWRVVGVPGDGVVPSGGPAHGAEHQHPLELGEPLRLVAGPVGERAVRDLVAYREPPGAAPEQGLHERKGGQVLQGIAADVRRLRGPWARDVGGAWGAPATVPV
jgi:hypothetical protein